MVTKVKLNIKEKKDINNIYNDFNKRTNNIKTIYRQCLTEDYDINKIYKLIIDEIPTITDSLNNAKQFIERKYSPKNLSRDEYEDELLRTHQRYIELDGFFCEGNFDTLILNVHDKLDYFILLVYINNGIDILNFILNISTDTFINDILKIRTELNKNYNKRDFYLFPFIKYSELGEFILTSILYRLLVAKAYIKILQDTITCFIFKDEKMITQHINKRHLIYNKEIDGYVLNRFRVLDKNKKRNKQRLNWWNVIRREALYNILNDYMKYNNKKIKNTSAT